MIILQKNIGYQRSDNNIIYHNSLFTKSYLLEENSWCT